jgi:hypothetical protein
MKMMKVPGFSVSIEEYLIRKKSRKWQTGERGRKIKS